LEAFDTTHAVVPGRAHKVSNYGRPVRLVLEISSGHIPCRFRRRLCFMAILIPSSKLQGDYPPRLATIKHAHHADGGAWTVCYVALSAAATAIARCSTLCHRERTSATHLRDAYWPVRLQNVARWIYERFQVSTRRACGLASHFFESPHTGSACPRSGLRPIA